MLKMLIPRQAIFLSYAIRHLLSLAEQRMYFTTRQKPCQYLNKLFCNGSRTNLVRIDANAGAHS